MADYSSWKVADLKAELKKRGIPQTSLRLKQHFIDKLAEGGTKVQPTDTAGPEPGNDVQQDRAPETVSTTEESQTEQPPAEQQPDEPLQPEAPHALQVEPTPENAPDEDTQPVHLEAQADEKHGQPVTGPDTEPTEDVEMSEAVPDEVKPVLTEATEQAVEKLDAEKSAEISAPQTEANIELSTPLPVEEAMEDKRKRKRRSQSPVPTAEAIANKKARAQEDGLQVPLEDDKQEDTKQTTTQDQLPVPTATEESPPRPNEQNAQLRGLLASSEAAAAQSTSEGQDITMEDATVEAALHSATASLYIDGIQRPLNPTSLRNHLVDLATAPGTSSDPQVVCELYLDPIKTHCFVQFATTAAAARARSKIHGTVWPAERHRKKLRADFIPDQQIKKFIETEEASRDRPGRPVRWEVKYESTNDNVTAVLAECESDSHAKSEQVRKAEFNRTPPSGPRGSAPQELRPSNAPPAPPSRPGQGFKPLDELFESTTAKPKLYYLPVPRKVADKRLDQFDELLRKGTFARRGGDEMRRITFEDEDYFADAGAEYGVRALQRRQARGGRGGDSRRGR